MSTETRPEPQQIETGPTEGLDRRTFLGGLGGATVGALSGGLTAVVGNTLVTGVAHATTNEAIGPESADDRREMAFQIRHEAAKDEKQLGATMHHTNGDEAAFANRIGNFHKTLPHNATTGEVDPAAYNAMHAAIDAGDFAAFNAVPGLGVLLNPLGAIAWNLEGPDAAAITTPPPPSVTSPELAAEMAEMYWMALCRDVPFHDAGGNDNWASHPTILAACADLNQFVALGTYKGAVDPISGLVTPQTLFRMNSPGVLTGPMTSQFLIRDWVWDNKETNQQGATTAVGADFMTMWNEFVNVQNGIGAGTPLDPVRRWVRSPRDIGMVAFFDRIYTKYLQAAHIAQNFANLANGIGMDAAWPYQVGMRQSGFASFGLAWVWEAIGSVGKHERATWYQKWNVHRFLRPEAFGGLVHRVAADGATYPLHSDLFNVSTVLPQIFTYNQNRNAARGFGPVGTYLLPMMTGGGSPTHPSYPAGHGYTAGACITLLKAIYDETRPWAGAQVVAPDGLSRLPYVGPPLTLGGELNKLAHNMTHGRDISGVHWRSDGFSALRQGEEFAIRWLREQNATYREPFTGFTVTKFDGTVVTIS